MSLQKAKFKVTYEGKTKPVEFDVLFNPSQYQISKAARYTNPEKVDTHSSTRGSDGTTNKNNKKNYIGTSDATLTLELFLDTTVPEYYNEDVEQPDDVKVLVDRFMDMCVATDGEHKPPKVQFCWGSQIFEGYVHSVNATYLMFDYDGKPLRARVNLTISEAEMPGRNVRDSKSSPDRTKARVVSDDVSIFHIAYREFADPGLWKLICKANNIANPLDIPAGTVLKVPALD